MTESGSGEDGQRQALGEPGAEHDVFHPLLGSGQHLAARGR
jgi:hypothetical protein